MLPIATAEREKIQKNASVEKEAR